MRFVKLLAMIILATVSVHAQGIGERPGLAGRLGSAVGCWVVAALLPGNVLCSLIILLVRWHAPSLLQRPWINSTVGNQCNDLEISTPTNGAVGVSNSLSCDYITGQTWTNNHFAQATLNVIPSAVAMVCVEFSGASGSVPQGYCAGANPNINTTHYYLFICTAGSCSTLTSVVQTPTVNDVMNLQDVSGTLTFSVNGTAIITTSDSTYTTGQPGIYIQAGTNGQQNLKSFIAGSG